MNPLGPDESASSSRSIDVTIIGGSIAGLQTAILLAQGHANVQLFDASNVRNAQPRTLIATAHLCDALGFFPTEAVVNEVRTIELVSQRHSVKVTLPKADLIVERATIVSILAKKAIAAGVRIYNGHKFLGFEATRRGVNLRIQDKTDKRVHEFYTQRLVGADGAFSQVASAARMNGLLRVPLLQAIVDLPHDFDASNATVWFEPEESPYFYWLIPQSATKAAVGLIANESTTAKKKLERFLNARALTAAQFQAAWIPLSTSTHTPWRKISGCDIYLVGDAAGHVKVTTVGGLVTGLWGAQAAAASILKRIPYVEALRPLRRELRLHELIRRALNRFRPVDYDRLLQAVDRSTARLLSRHNRDELSTMALKLIFTQPRLLGFLPRLLGPAKIADTLPRPLPEPQIIP